MNDGYTTMSEEHVNLMRSSQTEKEWNDNCDTVKAAYGGYPSDWYPKVVLSGLMREVAARFGKDDKIRAALDLKISTSTGELREALVLFRDETEQCEFWLSVAEDLTEAIAKARALTPKGSPAHACLTAALVDARAKAIEHGRNTATMEECRVCGRETPPDIGCCDYEDP